MIPHLICSLVLLLLLINSAPTFAKDFNTYMQEWNQKRALATQSLLEAEKYLKQGDKYTSCLKQKQASKLGVEATESLIQAMKVNGSIEGIENFESGLNKWRELGDFCE